jgi:hypothetical protein
MKQLHFLPILLDQKLLKNWLIPLSNYTESFSLSMPGQLAQFVSIFFSDSAILVDNLSYPNFSFYLLNRVKEKDLVVQKFVNNQRKIEYQHLLKERVPFLPTHSLVTE